MTETLPILAHASAQCPVAYRAGVAISAGQFRADVRRVAALLPAARHVLNLCGDRYRFTVGLAATLVRGQVSLLPPTYAPEFIRSLRAFAPDSYYLTDDPHAELDLPRVRYPSDSSTDGASGELPRIPAEQQVAMVFTSGSTGAPVAHAKTWKKLVANVRVEAERMGLLDGRPHTLVATVPAQHMYGLESSVLVALQSGQAFCAERPFYAADIVATLAAVPGPRVLVSTPIHLRNLLASGTPLPSLALVLCATAPLDGDLARNVEARTGAPLLEIYGSTETGQIASRHPTRTLEWELWPGVRLARRENGTWADGGHLEGATPLADLVVPTGPDRFLLEGRTADVVNIGGKRSSIAYLTHQLNAIPGVEDGVFYLPDAAEGALASGGTARLAALAVAPGLTTETILQELRRRIDPVFLPRPLRLVATIARNATGKLPRAALKALAAEPSSQPRDES